MFPNTQHDAGSPPHTLHSSSLTRSGRRNTLNKNIFAKIKFREVEHLGILSTLYGNSYCIRVSFQMLDEYNHPQSSNLLTLIWLIKIDQNISTLYLILLIYPLRHPGVSVELAQTDTASFLCQLSRLTPGEYNLISRYHIQHSPNTFYLLHKEVADP